MSFSLPLQPLAKRLIARAPKGLGGFLAVGVAGLALHTGVFTALFHLGLDKRVAWLCALCVATLLTWTLNRKLTFEATGRRRSIEVARYALVTVVAQGVSFSVFLLSGRVAPWLPASLCVIVGAAVATLFSYTGQRFFTFAAPRTPDGEVIVTDIPVA
jgi:putative flippase GtrA